MSRPTALRLGGGLALLALAAFAFLLARDVWQVRAALRDGDAHARARAVDPAAWSADTVLPAALSRSLLGTDDDLAFRRLAVRARAVTPRPATDDEVRRRAPLKAALLEAENDADRRRAAEAAHLLGLIYLTDPSDPDRPAGEKALEELARSVRLDPGNETAKRNLELVLQAQSEDSILGRRGVSGGEQPGQSGAGLRAGGYGY